MRVIVGGAVALLALGALAAPAAAQQATSLRIAYINSQRIMDQAPGRAEAEQQFEREVGSYRQQIQGMEDSLRTMVQTFEREQASLAAAVRQQRATALQTRETEYQRRADTLNQQMQRRQAELVRPIMEQINRVIDAVRAEGQYAFIFDVAAEGQGIVAADTTLDITPTVIARLRAAGPPSASNSPAMQQQPAGVTRPRQ
ncbi:MAG TPA: OmpH family outer membrane protein [Gemmatimonadaceae bacterium]|nr:OmpH family outer membrane protein [Gemmatimonadaceae bacterium]